MKGLDNKFNGKNFVFDERLGERITEEMIAHCHHCGKPCDIIQIAKMKPVTCFLSNVRLR